MKKETRVPGDSDRDQSIDRLLKQALPGTGAPPSAACLDAETLAAWSEGALPGQEAAHVEVHLSTCGRCQAIVAAFVRTEPIAPAVVPLWQRSSVRWLIPLAAAAAAVVWFVLPRPEIATTLPQVTRVEPSATAPAAQAAPLATPLVAAADRPAAAASSRPVEPRPQRPALPTVAEAKAQPAPVSPPARAATQLAAPPPAPELPPPPPPPPASTTLPAAVGFAGGVPPTAGAANRVSAAASEATVLEAIVEIVAPSPAMDQLSAPAAAGAGFGGRGGAGAAGGRGGGRGAATPVVNVPARWRILPSGRVERSTDNGASWTPVVIDPPVTPTGGVAVSSTICWLIGRAGVILRAVDGVHFDRLKFPETVDLASIRSTGAAQATVTALDGRVFVSEDGGLTWRLQGFLSSPF
jgi:hypothetical protein